MPIPNFLKKTARTIACLVAAVMFAVMLNGCGSTSTNVAATSTSGSWQAVLTGGAGPASVLDFNTAFTVNGDGSLDVTAFSFNTTGTCFVSGQSESGSADLSTSSTDQVTGTFNFQVVSGSPPGETLAMTGTVTGTQTTTASALTAGTITGTWTLTGSGTPAGCTGGGAFTMCQSGSTCTLP